MGRQTRCDRSNNSSWNFAYEEYYSMEPAFERALTKAGLKGFVRGQIMWHREIDFYYPKQQLAIEIDGLFHCIQRNLIKDKCKDRLLESRGIKVLRYSNDQVRFHCSECIREVKKVLAERNINVNATCRERVEIWKMPLYDFKCKNFGRN